MMTRKRKTVISWNDFLQNLGLSRGHFCQFRKGFPLEKLITVISSKLPQKDVNKKAILIFTSKKDFFTVPGMILKWLEGKVENSLHIERKLSILLAKIYNDRMKVSHYAILPLSWLLMNWKINIFSLISKRYFIKWIDFVLL